MGLPGWLRVLISIHALLAESDSHCQRSFHCVGNYFYPRSPCGERHIIDSNCNLTQKFLSTLSLRRATYRISARYTKRAISIHALLAESDICTSINIASDLEFLSTLSLRRATDQGANNHGGRQISIHALLAESDPRPRRRRRRGCYFYPRSPCGERPSANVRSSP